jgi:hypothetical protein
LVLESALVPVPVLESVLVLESVPGSVPVLA